MYEEEETSSTISQGMKENFEKIIRRKALGTEQSLECGSCGNKLHSSKICHVTKGEDRRRCGMVGDFAKYCKTKGITLIRNTNLNQQRLPCRKMKQVQSSLITSKNHLMKETCKQSLLATSKNVKQVRILMEISKNVKQVHSTSKNVNKRQRKLHGV